MFAGTRIRIDGEKDLRFKAAELNRLLRAVDENEQFYNVNNYQNNTPDKLVKHTKKCKKKHLDFKRYVYYNTRFKTFRFKHR